MVFLAINNKSKYVLFSVVVFLFIIFVKFNFFLNDEQNSQIKGKICIVIDDFGYSENDLHRDFLTLPNDISISIIPGYSYSEDIAHMAYKYGFETLIHMPMEAHKIDLNDNNEYLLTTNLNYDQIYNKIENAFVEIPYASGINNHQGSKATENIQLMKNIARSLKKMNKFFLDSYTSINSKAFMIMRQNGVKTEVRQIFLDHINDPDSIKVNLEKLVSLSHKMDVAIGIGHVKEETYKILKEEIPKLKKLGYEFLNVSDIVR